MSEVFLSIGGNLGDRLRNLAICQRYLQDNLGGIDEFSPVYESESWGFKHPADFYNQVLKCRTEMSPHTLLQVCLKIEADMGRHRNANGSAGYQGRSIDIDIIFYDRKIIRQNNLNIPHPYLYDRLFVLRPMYDIAPDFIDPASKKSIRQLLADCPDTGRIVKKAHPSKLLDYE